MNKVAIPGAAGKIARLAIQQFLDETSSTQKSEPCKGTEVSRKSIADLVVKFARHPKRDARGSLGIDKPGTNGDKPSWY